MNSTFKTLPPVFQQRWVQIKFWHLSSITRALKSCFDRFTLSMPVLLWQGWDKIRRGTFMFMMGRYIWLHKGWRCFASQGNWPWFCYSTACVSCLCLPWGFRAPGTQLWLWGPQVPVIWGAGAFTLWPQQTGNTYMQWFVVNHPFLIIHKMKLMSYMSSI